MRLAAILARRAIASVAVLVVAASLGWFAAQASSSADAELFGRETAASRAAERAESGLDAAAGTALLRWWRAAVRLDFGQSIRYRRAVTPLVFERARNSALLALAALACALAVGLPLGVLSASSRPWVAGAIRWTSVVALSAPPLIVALVLSWLAVRLRWGLVDPSAASGSWSSAARAMLVPLASLVIPLAATFERMQSRAFAGVAHEPSLRAALARGIPERRVRWRHAWRLSTPPVAAAGGTVAGAVLSGALAVEVITAWPGLGRLTFDALMARDAPLVAGCALATGVLVSIAALVADAVVAWADPRAGDAA